MKKINLDEKKVKTPKIFAKDFKEKEVRYKDLKLPKFVVKFQSFKQGIIVLALHHEKIEVIKHTITSLIIFNIAFTHYEKQR